MSSYNHPEHHIIIRHDKENRQIIYHELGTFQTEFFFSQIIKAIFLH